MSDRLKSLDTTADEVDLIGSIYEAALDRSRWSDVITRTAKACNAHIGCHTTFFPAEKRVAFMTWPGGDVKALMAKGHHIDNPWTRSGFAEASGVMRTDDLCPLDVLKRSAWYREGLQHHDAEHGLVSTVHAEGGAVTTFSILRSERRGPFGEAETARLTRLFPHLQRAAQVDHRLARAQAEREDLAIALDGMRAAVFLVDGAGRVCFANDSAERLANRGELLRVRGGVLTAADESLREALQHLIREAVRTGSGAGLSSGGCLPLHDAVGRPVDVLVTPLGRDGTWRLIGRPRAMVVVGGVPTPEPTLDAVLCRFYGFTAAEARLVLALVESDGLTAAAGELGITLNTARTHLKRVFEKTGTRRQSDLIRRLLRGPLALR